MTAWKPFEDRTVSGAAAAAAGCFAWAAADGELGCAAPKANRATVAAMNGRISPRFLSCDAVAVITSPKRRTRQAAELIRCTNRRISAMISAADPTAKAVSGRQTCQRTSAQPREK